MNLIIRLTAYAHKEGSAMVKLIPTALGIIKPISEIIELHDKRKEREQEIKMLTLAYERSRQGHWILQPE